MMKNGRQHALYGVRSEELCTREVQNMSTEKWEREKVILSKRRQIGMRLAPLRRARNIESVSYFTCKHQSLYEEDMRP